MTRLLLVLCALPVAAHAFPDGAPSGHTGGFGEPDCGACHFGGTSPPGNAALRLQGLPASYSPGETYELTLHLEDEGLTVSGFQLSVRWRQEAPPDTDAGRLQPPSDGLRLESHADVSYLGHADDAAGGTSGRKSSWTFEWQAPISDAGTVVFHAAAVAGDGDRSPVGGRVYRLEQQLPPE